MKKFICTAMALVSLFGMTFYGGKISNVRMSEQMVSAEAKSYDLFNIAYQKTGLTQQSKPDQVGVTLSPVPNFETGEEMYASVNLYSTFSDSQPYYYAIVDWGDGTWGYNGPYQSSTQGKSAPELKHTYRKSGTYKVKACVVNLSNGKLYGWSDEKSCTVTGSEYVGNLIKTLQPFASSVQKGKADDILDGNASTYLKTKNAADATVEEYVGLFFDDFYRLDALEIQFPSSESYFPSNIAVEYTTDGGTTWYALPKYYYYYDYNENRYSPIMKFPNPTGATLAFAMDGIVANGVRISGKLFLNDQRSVSVSEMRAYGDKELLLYSSNGHTYDADLNNMWTIYGTATTEPIVIGNIFSSQTNKSPFRTGCAEILSTEWAEWNGLKFNWTNEADERAAYQNQLINIRCGDDGWSDNAGYVYATASAPKHLGEQNHYTLNPIYIMAVRNYLLQGNDTVILENGTKVDFMDATNNYGQSIRDKLDMAMNYMLTTLEGDSGIITIYDPENDGTTNGNASNYWDTHRSFGYKSAYENALFYGSLLAMADIENYYGNTTEAQKYLDIAAKSKEVYNKLFWDEAKGRYINSINIKGERIDFGMTVVNYYAVAYGLASEYQAQLIYDWVDGKRIINGDTSQGADIYGEFIYASRTNTVDVSTTGEPYYWWDHGGALPCTPGTFGGFGHQMQNGGTIFYISYYDMMGRINKLGADSANSRFSVIMKEFHKDSLRRNRYMTHVTGGVQGGGEYSEGVLGEFPESGLVPLTFVTGFLGLNACSQGLKIAPSLPTEYDYAGIREYHFGNRVYSIQVNKNYDTPEVQYDGTKYFVRLPADKDYIITYDNRLIEA